ncbi:MAG: winged helix-turn-helix transcriptional regulator, partial [Muribaculaceae bacterium]|nr:winged helix-turn-helix transcriptional regulator [Muribaculaceae bacterium]
KEVRTKNRIEAVYDLVKANPRITYKEIMETLQIGYSSVYESIKQLKRQGILSREGGLYGGYWKLNEDLYFQLYPRN